MSEQRYQVQVGIVFILAIIVLIWGVLWFKDFKIRGTSYDMKVEFATASGLIKGDPVEVQGVPSGKVAAITFENGRSVVTMQLDEDIKLYPHTKVVLENVGIMGQKLVAVYPGPPAEVLPPGSVLQGEYQPGIPQLMSSLGGSIVTFERLATRLDTLLAAFDESDQETLTRTLQNTERVTGQLADILQRNHDDLSMMLKDMQAATHELRIGMEGRGDELGVLLEGAAKASGRLDTTLVMLQQTLGRMDSMIATVDSSQGTLSQVLHDRALYDELVITVQDTRALLNDVKQNPRRYFKVSVF
jgi:phospholipid/cholesterol/gamma-HCH transport system substrate-binding protein